ncbi:MAG: class I SAM-dependent methyltransferase [Roseburia sp.]|nr:class I SAM-dependent methyltransferase [Roseburia sp.]MCM1201645.1 class I SAM-dependent methyltransferase [Bacteroides fragilis]
MDRFIIYGCGNKGKWCLDFLKWRNMDDRIYAFCDKRYDELNEVGGKKVLSYEEARNQNLPFLLAIANPEITNEVMHLIQSDNCKGYLLDDFYKILGEDQTVYLREWCAYHHARNNDQWFTDAEDDNEVDIFWNKDSLFSRLFNQLDLTNVIELACGHGRHVPHYMDKAGIITLVDILDENMVICRKRFKDAQNINYYKNNGYNLEKLPADSYTSLFTYDSMVHFEMMDVYEYLKDIYRVLISGGKALFHHSNYSEDYKTDFAHTQHARCFMSKNIFAYLAYRTGFKILEQHVIDWHGAEALDCITLVEKQ